MVELATPDGTKQSLWGTNKNGLRVLSGRTQGRYDEIRNSPNSGRMQRNCCKVFRKQSLGVEYG